VNPAMPVPPQGSARTCHRLWRPATSRTMGRAGATRQSMLTLIDKGKPEEAHPAYWEPFVVAGEDAY
jgi:CHAT domain-containing protein